MSLYGAGAHVWFGDFMPLLCKHLADNLKGMTIDRVFRSMWEEKWHLSHPVADRFITVSEPRAVGDQGAISGGGDFNTPFDTQVVTRAFVRLEADPEGKSTKVLEDEVNGVDTFILGIIDLLHMWVGPLSAGEELHMFRRPMRVLSFEKNPRTAPNDSRWVVIPITYELSFVASVGTASYP